MSASGGHFAFYFEVKPDFSSGNFRDFSLLACEKNQCPPFRLWEYGNPSHKYENMHLKWLAIGDWPSVTLKVITIAAIRLYMRQRVLLPLSW